MGYVSNWIQPAEPHHGHDGVGVQHGVRGEVMRLDVPQRSGTSWGSVA
jgi:hypothetical protein